MGEGRNFLAFGTIHKILVVHRDKIIKHRVSAFLWVVEWSLPRGKTQALPLQNNQVFHLKYQWCKQVCTSNITRCANRTLAGNLDEDRPWSRVESIGPHALSPGRRQGPHCRVSTVSWGPELEHHRIWGPGKLMPQNHILETLILRVA